MNKNLEKVFILIGSPKGKKSASNNITSYIEKEFNKRGIKAQKEYIVNYKDPETLQELMERVNQNDILVIVAPLYIDSIPAITINFMEKYYNYRNANPKSEQKLLAIFNSGFPEPNHNDLALAMCKNFAFQSNIEWVGGITIGMGAAFEHRSLEKSGGMSKNLRKGLDSMIESLSKDDPVPPEAMLIASKPLMPLILSKFVMRFFGNMMWKKRVKNKKTQKKMYDQPYALN